MQRLLFRYAGLNIKSKENKTKQSPPIIKAVSSLYSFGGKGENTEQLIA